MKNKKIILIDGIVEISKNSKVFKKFPKDEKVIFLNLTEESFFEKFLKNILIWPKDTRSLLKLAASVFNTFKFLKVFENHSKITLKTLKKHSKIVKIG